MFKFRCIVCRHIFEIPIADMVDKTDPPLCPRKECFGVGLMQEVRT